MSEFNKDDWRSKAACLGMDSDIFFVDRGTSNKQALEVCSTCEVTYECADFAARCSHPVITYGVWGGLGTKAVRRRRAELVESGELVDPPPFRIRGYDAGN